MSTQTAWSANKTEEIDVFHGKKGWFTNSTKFPVALPLYHQSFVKAIAGLLTNSGSGLSWPHPASKQVNAPCTTCLTSPCFTNDRPWWSSRSTENAAIISDQSLRRSFCVYHVVKFTAKKQRGPCLLFAALSCSRYDMKLGCKLRLVRKLAQVSRMRRYLQFVYCSFEL